MIWEGDNFTAETEIRGIKSILSNNDVEFTELHFNKHSLFRKNYESGDYDFIHVSFHGEFSYNAPHSAEIQLGNDKNIPLKELKRLNKEWDGRRLLFLNICDGATTSLLNSPASIGFSPILVHPGQSLFGHLWPVNPIVAMIYGWLVTTLLARGFNYEEVYSKTVLLMQQGKYAITEFLEKHLEKEFMEQIEHFGIDVRNFAHSGSLVYMV